MAQQSAHTSPGISASSTRSSEWAPSVHPTSPADCVPGVSPAAVLDREVKEGLDAQRDWSLGNLSAQDNAKAIAPITKVAACLRRLAQQGFSSPQSRAWLT